MNLLVILLSCIGLTFILKYGSILSFVRKPLIKLKFFKELFSCSLCLGFWSGVFHGMFFYFVMDGGYACFLFPTLSSFLSWFFDGIVDLIHTYSIHLNRKDMFSKKHLENMEKSQQHRNVFNKQDLLNAKTKTQKLATFDQMQKPQEVPTKTPCKSCGKK